MQYMTTHSMKTMQYVPKLDQKLLRYTLSFMAAAATSTVTIVAVA